MKLIKHFVVLYAMLLVSCQPEEEYVLVKNEFFSEKGLRKWNDATDEALDIYKATNNSEFQEGSLAHVLNYPQEDTIIGLKRKEYFGILHETKALADSITYDSIYIIEYYLSGERIHIEKYFIVNKDNSSIAYFTELSQGKWQPVLGTETSKIPIDSYFEIVPSSTEDMKYVGVFLIITKIAGEGIATRVYDKLPQERYSKLLQTLPYPNSN